jgi:3-amino-4-hydroxybenzoic acid synthase
VTSPIDPIPLWVDLSDSGNRADLLTAVVQSPLAGVIVAPAQLPAQPLSPRQHLAVLVKSAAELDQLDAVMPMTVLVRDPDLISKIPDGPRRGLWIEVEDAASMHRAVAALGAVDVLMVSFTDPTNIPLELVVAEAQSSQTMVVKRVVSLADALVSRGVLEHGPAAVVLQVNTPEDIFRLSRAFLEHRTESLKLVEAEVTRTVSIGMGMRGCIDTVSLFEPDEGILVGSTSSGGLLVCAEVHHLPYMNLRPFRVNAGAVHSYVWTPAGRTAYITDLAAGEPVLAVSTDGQARPVLVGRVKTELRPLRLIECRIGDSLINTIVQDDWHVRFFGADEAVRNCTSIAPGDRMLAVPASPGRHVGIPVSESIVES